MDNTYTNSIIMHLQDQLDTPIIAKNIKKNNPLMPKKQYFKQGTYQYLTTRSIDFENIPYNKNQRFFYAYIVFNIQINHFSNIYYINIQKVSVIFASFPILDEIQKKKLKHKLLISLNRLSIYHILNGPQRDIL